MKKYFTAFICFSFIAIFITAICMVNFKPIESLMKPPMSSGENQEIQIAFKNAVNEEFKLKAPLNGEYRSSYIFEDLNGDSQDEVIVFYSTDDAVDIIRMNCLMKIDQQWTSVADLESSYSEVQQVEFSDLDNDGTKEILVGWAVYQNDLARNLKVYESPTSSGIFKEVFSSSYIDFQSVDVDNDKVNDLVVFNGAPIVELLFYKFKNTTSYDMFSIPLDFSVNSIMSLSYDYYAKKEIIRLFIDSYTTSGGIITECVYWNSKSKSMEKLTNSDGLCILSSRKTAIDCQDINEDGLIEIPIEVELADSIVVSANNSDSQSQKIIQWTQIGFNYFEIINNQLIYNNNDFRITFDKDWIKNISVKNDLTNNSICFYSTQEGQKVILFELKYITSETEEETLSDKYELLVETKKGKIFYLIYNSDRTLNINKFFMEKVVIV